jgi:hypothetical protein
MKNTLLILATAAALALGAVCLVQFRKGSEQQSNVVSLRAEVEQRSNEIEDLQAAKKRAERQRRELKDQAEGLALQLQARHLAESNAVAVAAALPPPAGQTEQPAEPRSDFGTMLSKMMQDPEARKLMREQQRMMMEQLYVPLVKRMGLTPEEAAQFTEMQADHAVNAAGKAFAMFGKQGSSKGEDSFSGLPADQKSFDEQVKALLGEQRYAQYQVYQESVPQRMQLNAYKQQAGSDYNLTEPQTEALLVMMQEESKSVAATMGLPLEGAAKDPAKIKALLAEGKMDQLLQGQEAVSQRVYERARTILSPDQLASLARFQTNQMQTMRVGMSMAKKMFAGEAAEPGAAGPAQ